MNKKKRRGVKMQGIDHRSEDYKYLSQIMVVGENSPSPRLPLHSFLAPSRPTYLTREEILTRRVYSYLDGRRWGYARKEREQLLHLALRKGASPVPVFLLEGFSDIFEGKTERARNAYQRAIKEPSSTAYTLDIYILREFISYMSPPDSEEMVGEPSEQDATEIPWFFSPVANALYRSKTDPQFFAINELGQIADALISEPGTKRFVALILRGIQGKRLLERGEYPWAERVLTYTAERAEKLMNFNGALGAAVLHDLQTAQQGVAHLSFQ